MMKRRIALILCIILSIGLITGCGGDVDKSDDSTGDGGRIKDELIIGTTADINNLDLQKQSDQINNIVLKLTHEPLIFFRNDGEIEPNLCKSYEVVDDTHIVFDLHEGMTFHDGSPLTAEDIKFTFDMAIDDGMSTLSHLVEVNVIDPLKVELVTKSYSNEFLRALAEVPASIQSKKAYESGMEEPYLMGSGPYKFESWEQDEAATFVINENYWREDKKSVTPKITFRPIKEASTRAVALQNGEIDVCIDPSTDNLPDLEADDNVTVHEQAGTRLFYLGLNVEKKPWDSLKLRQAVAHAIDKESIIDVVLDGKGFSQTTILNRGLWGFYDEMEGFPYDVDKAKQLLKESGYEQDESLSILISNESDYNVIAQIVQANLKEIGLAIDLETVEPATLKTECQSGTQGLYLWRWNEDISVDLVYRDLFYTGEINNYSHYSDEYVDELTDLVLTEKDEDKRLEYAQELQEYLVDDVPQVPLYIKNLIIAYNKNLKGAYLFGGGNHDWRFAYIEE